MRKKMFFHTFGLKEICFLEIDLCSVFFLSKTCIFDVIELAILCKRAKTNSFGRYLLIFALCNVKFCFCWNFGQQICVNWKKGDWCLTHPIFEYETLWQVILWIWLLRANFHLAAGAVILKVLIPSVIMVSNVFSDQSECVTKSLSSSLSFWRKFVRFQSVA